MIVISRSHLGPHNNGQHLQSSQHIENVNLVYFIAHQFNCVLCIDDKEKACQIQQLKCSTLVLFFLKSIILMCNSTKLYLYKYFTHDL